MPETMQEKLTKAIEWLGRRWVHHPESTFDASRMRVHGSILMSQIRAAAVAAGRLN